MKLIAHVLTQNGQQLTITKRNVSLRNIEKIASKINQALWTFEHGPKKETTDSHQSSPS